MQYAKHYNRRATPQNEALPGQAQNNAGGFAWALDDWKRLDRFLILGSEGGTYYQAEKALTRENAKAVDRCIQQDAKRVVDRVVEISDAGRAPKNDPALFVLALCASAPNNPPARTLAVAALPKVARIGTHLFQFASYVNAMRGWGRGLRRGIANWYNTKPIGQLTEQVVKYQQRGGWSHRDLLRLAHPKWQDAFVDGTQARAAVYNAVTKPDEPLLAGAPDYLATWRGLSGLSKEALFKAIALHRYPREALPTEVLNDINVWRALLPHMPMTAMIRNLGKMSALGMFNGDTSELAHVTMRLTDAPALRKARVHPLAVLVAMSVYIRGRGEKGSLTWPVNAGISKALEDAFYLSFGSVAPTGKRILIGLDVSGSMGSGPVAGSPLTPREAAAALCLVTAAVEQNTVIRGFSHEFVDLGITKNDRLADAVHKTSCRDFGGTDCALPMLYATRSAQKFDAFIIYTDSETWFGKTHPSEALRDYRAKYVPDAKLIVVGMTASGFSIADPNDAGMLDVVGFDTAVPNVMSDFIRGAF